MNLKNIKKRFIGNVDSLTSGSVVGTTVTALTIYSHTDSLFNISKVARSISEYWREIIAFPWEIIAAVFGFEIAKPTAGLLTVLLATLLVVKTSWEETSEYMSFKFRSLAVLVCSLIGFLYSAYIIVPALYDKSAPAFEVMSIAIEVLASVYYTQSQIVDVVSWPLALGITAFIICMYAVLLYWPYRRVQSTKSYVRVGAGVVLGFLFLIMMLDRVVYSFLPISLGSNNTLENVMLFFAMASILIAPYISSIYLADPKTSAKRNFSIASLLLLILALDILALGFEWMLLKVMA